MSQCGEQSYIIRRLEQDNLDKPDIVLNKGDINNTFGVTLLGRRRREYGETFNENTLHLLEHFACESISESDPIYMQVPDITKSTVPHAFTNPVEGQLWYNKSIDRIYYWGKLSGLYTWVPLHMTGDVAGNSGMLLHGATLPRPENQITGEAFEYDECAWNVSPAYYPDEIDYMICDTKQIGNDIVVEVLYKVAGTHVMVPGIANYQIIAITGNNNI